MKNEMIVLMIKLNEDEKKVNNVTYLYMNLKHYKVRFVRYKALLKTDHNYDFNYFIIFIFDIECLKLNALLLSNHALFHSLSILKQLEFMKFVNLRLIMMLQRSELAPSFALVILEPKSL